MWASIPSSSPAPCMPWRWMRTRPSWPLRAPAAPARDGEAAASVVAASAAAASAVEAVERFEGSVIFLFVILSEGRSAESKDPYRRSNLSLKRGSCWLLVPPVAQILPLRVALFDQRNLSLPLPTLQLFFASNGCRNLPIGLVIEHLRCAQDDRMGVLGR